MFPWNRCLEGKMASLCINPLPNHCKEMWFREERCNDFRPKVSFTTVVSATLVKKCEKMLLCGRWLGTGLSEMWMIWSVSLWHSFFFRGFLFIYFFLPMMLKYENVNLYKSVIIKLKIKDRQSKNEWVLVLLFYQSLSGSIKSFYFLFTKYYFFINLLYKCNEFQAHWYLIL